MENPENTIANLAKSLQACIFTPKQLQEQKQKEFLEAVNQEEKTRILNEKKVPEGLRKHIPTTAAKYGRLNEEARKNKRKDFTLHKALPEPIKFKTGNKNKKLGNAISSLAQHFQSNSKHTLGGLLEVATDISHIGQEIHANLQFQLQQIPRAIRHGYQEGAFRSEILIDKFIAHLTAEFDKHLKTLADLQDQCKKLDNLIFLQGDSYADGIEQIKQVCLALKNLKSPANNIYPTREEYREAIRAGPRRFNNRYQHRGGYRHRGGGRGRGNRGGGRNNYYRNQFNNNYSGGYNNSNNYQSNSGNSYGQ